MQTRLAVALVSAATIALELALMRMMSLRFWHHFAYMVISVALVGFGASGTALTLLRERIQSRRRAWLCATAMAFALTVPITTWAVGKIPLNVQSLAWDLSQLAYVLAVEALMVVPFFLSGAMIGVVLMDHPGRVGGHYAANLVGSGAGAIASVLLMHVLGATDLLVVVIGAGWLAGAVLIPWRRVGAAVAGCATAALIVAVTLLVPPRPAMSQYKMLPQLLEMPDTRTIARSEGPLGRIDVVSGDAIHHAPGLSLQYTESIPPHVVVITDGDATSAVYDCSRREDWAFLDHTTAAGAYHLGKRPRALILGAGGGSDIGLALFHGCDRITALEMNPQIVELMRGPLSGRGGAVYDAPGVRVVVREARGYLTAAEETFDVIQLPLIDAFGASGAGLYATQESYLYTVESFSIMLDALSEEGVLCVTRWARTPPRDGLRVFDTMAAALRARDLDPRTHLAMIRSWATVTVLAFRREITPEETDALRAFCRERSFDPAYLPGLAQSETNQFHVLDRPYYFEAAEALLGPERQAFLADYLFSVGAATDDKPYFYKFFRWKSLAYFADRMGAGGRAFVELGYVMVPAALIQIVLLAAILIVLPLAPGLRALTGVRGRAATLGYFLLLGAGFMLLEMGFLQKLILYLAHPIYSAAVVIASFLVFGGLGSRLSQSWSPGARRVGTYAAGAIVCISIVYVFILDRWLGLTQTQPVAIRFLLAAGTIAPLALAMGHMFPTGLRLVGAAEGALVPWAWAVNGFASVVATVAAPLVAMHVGFSRLTIVAVVCYALAGMLCRALPGDAR